MQDRTPKYPGRVTILPVQGLENTYTMERADEPTQPGTPLNKATLLNDLSAEMFGFGADAVPDDIFSFLGVFNLHWWRRRVNTASAGYQEVRTPGTGAYQLCVAYSGSNDDIVKYTKSISIDQTNGEITYLNQQSVDISYRTAESINRSYLRGCYIKASGSYEDDWVYIPTNAAISAVNSGDEYIVRYDAGNFYTVSSEYKMAGEIGDWEYLYSADRSAYPDSGISGNYEYEYIGVPYENFTHMPVKIEAGSYIGTGTSGNDNKTEITFTFPPKIWGVTAFRDTNRKLHAILNIFPFEPPTDGNNLIFISYSGADSYSRESYYSIDGNTLRIWSLYDAKYQLNNSGCIYYYFGIG